MNPRIVFALLIAFWLGMAAEAVGSHTQGFFMKAAEFNAIAARMGCQIESLDGDLLTTALTRVAECVAVRFSSLDERLKKLEGRRK